MDERERELIRRWVKTWQDAGPAPGSDPARGNPEYRYPDGVSEPGKRFQLCGAIHPAAADFGVGRDAEVVREAPAMNDLLEAAGELQVFCDARGWRSCIIGGLAVLRWGEPRVTRDISILAGFGSEDRFIEPLVAQYPVRIADAAAFALQNRVVLLKTAGGVGIDVSLSALPFEEEVIDRATPFSFRPGLDIRTCSAEDLLVLKLFASRPVDIRDAESIAIRQKDRLDWAYVENQLRPLVEVKGEPEILDALVRLRQL